MYIGYQEVLVLTEDNKLIEQIVYGLFNCEQREYVKKNRVDTYLRRAG